MKFELELTGHALLARHYGQSIDTIRNMTWLERDILTRMMELELERRSNPNA